MAQGLSSGIVPAGTEVYHCSTSLGRLTTSGQFDPEESYYGGVMFLSSEVTKHTNIVAVVVADLNLLVMTGMDNVFSSIVTELNREGTSRMTQEAERLGFNGLRANTPDYFTQRIDGTQCDELVIFGSSLKRLTSIRQFQL